MKNDKKQTDKLQSVQGKTFQKSYAGDMQPVKIELTGDAGKRVVLASARRVLKKHAEEIAALAYK